MINCPNCNKKVNERFEYCIICGSKLNGEKTGDFSTGINNLFKDEDGFYYLFAVNGKQVILRNENKDELKKEVLIRKYPWIEKNKPDAKNPSERKTHETENQTPIIEREKPIERKDSNEKIAKDSNITHHDNFAYVTKEEDVNFGKMNVYDSMTGQNYETWGPDNSERAKKMRKKIFK